MPGQSEWAINFIALQSLKVALSPVGRQQKRRWQLTYICRCTYADPYETRGPVKWVVIPILFCGAAVFKQNAKTLIYQKNFSILMTVVSLSLSIACSPPPVQLQPQLWLYCTVAQIIYDVCGKARNLYKWSFVATTYVHSRPLLAINNFWQVQNIWR